MTHDEQTPSDPPPDPKLPQRQQLVAYFGFAEWPGRTAPLTDEERGFIRARRITGIMLAGLVIGLLWASFGPLPALVLAVLGAIWFGSALRTYGRR